jgi:hypothetical protein
MLATGFGCAIMTVIPSHKAKTFSLEIIKELLKMIPMDYEKNYCTRA